MASYFYRGVYTSGALERLIAHEGDIEAAMRPSIARFGGTITACRMTASAEPHGFLEFPDNTAASAWVLYMLSEGLLRDATVIPMLTPQELREALRKTGKSDKPTPGEW